MQTFQNYQQKELTSRQESNWADCMPIISLENISSNIWGWFGLIGSDNGLKIGAEKGPVSSSCQQGFSCVILSSKFRREAHPPYQYLWFSLILHGHVSLSLSHELELIDISPTVYFFRIRRFMPRCQLSQFQQWLVLLLNLLWRCRTNQTTTEQFDGAGAVSTRTYGSMSYHARSGLRLDALSWVKHLRPIDSILPHITKLC